MPKVKHETPERILSRGVKRLLARLLIHFAGARSPERRPPAEVRSIMILAQEKLGDAILMTPLFVHLRHLFPHAEIVVAAFSPAGRFFRADPHVDRVEFVKENWLRFLRRYRGKVDLLFNSKDHPSFTFLFATAALNARHSAGFAHPFHRGYFNHVLDVPFHQHIVEKYCDFLRYLGGNPSAESCRPYLPDGEISPEVRQFMRSQGATAVLAVNLSAGEKDREWPLERWEEFLAEVRRPAIVLAMPARSGDKRRLESRFQHVIPSPATATIFDAAEIVRGVRCLVTPDTALVHVASCFDIPVVGLYRADPDHVQRFHPLSSHHRCLVSPSYRVEDIDVNEVVQAVEEMLLELGEKEREHARG